MKRFECVDDQKAAGFPVTAACEAAGVSTSGYYDRQQREAAGPTERQLAEAELVVLMRQLFDDADGNYGVPRMVKALRRAGLVANKKRVVRLMRLHGMAGRFRHRKCRTTFPGPDGYHIPDLVGRGFAPGQPDVAWCQDITYIPTAEGWLYLAVLVDVYSRRVVGWAMADHLRTELALDALAMALQARRPPPGLVHHTDRGCQYTAAAYQAALAARGIVCSMSRAGECLDNAMAERFFATLKAELGDARTWPTRAAARTAIFEWIEVWYNRQRRHSALAYQAPVAHEAQHLLLLLQDLAA